MIAIDERKMLMVEIAKLKRKIKVLDADIPTTEVVDNINVNDLMNRLKIPVSLLSAYTGIDKERINRIAKLNPKKMMAGMRPTDLRNWKKLALDLLALSQEDIPIRFLEDFTGMAVSETHHRDQAKIKNLAKGLRAKWDYRNNQQRKEEFYNILNLAGTIGIVNIDQLAKVLNIPAESIKIMKETDDFMVEEFYLLVSRADNLYRTDAEFMLKVREIIFNIDF